MKKKLFGIVLIILLVLLCSCKTAGPKAEVQQEPVEQKYTITYILGGGALPTGKSNPQLSYEIRKDTVLINPERIGYSFVGWIVQDSGNDPEINYKFSLPLKESLVLEAVWEPSTYKIKYDFGGETWKPKEEEPVEIEAVVYPDSYTIEDKDFTIPEAPEKAGYTFAGWRTVGSKDEAETSFTIHTASCVDYDLQAIWLPITYTIRYDLDGGNWTKEDYFVSYTVEDKIIIVSNNVEKEGYRLVGWKNLDSSGEDVQKYYVINPSKMQNHNLKAVWEPVTYKIEYDFDGALLTDPEVAYPSTYTIEDTDFEIPEAKRAGYEFVGWRLVGSEEDIQADYIIHTSDCKDYKIQAIWEPVTFSISYDLRGGRLPYGVRNPHSYSAETETFTLVAPSQDNCVFCGWILDGDANSSIQESVTIEKGSMGDRHYTAVFTWESVPLGYVTELQKAQAEWGKGGIPRPDWVVKMEDSDDYHYEKGYGKGSSFSDSLEIATKKALSAIAEWAGTEVYSISFNGSVVKDTDFVFYDNLAAITGREIVEYWEDSDGGVWVLLRVKNDSSLYRMLLSESALEHVVNLPVLQTTVSTVSNALAPQL